MTAQEIVVWIIGIAVALALVRRLWRFVSGRNRHNPCCDCPGGCERSGRPPRTLRKCGCETAPAAKPVAPACPHCPPASVSASPAPTEPDASPDTVRAEPATDGTVTEKRSAGNASACPHCRKSSGR